MTEHQPEADRAAAGSPPDPGALAALHAAAFTSPRPWSAAEFADLIASPQHLLLWRGDTAPGAPPLQALAVIALALDEADLLTIAVRPDSRGHGVGMAVLGQAMEESARRGARRMFLEVAEDNAAALSLYLRAGFVTSGRRRAYYRDGDRIADALLMARALDPARLRPGVAPCGEEPPSNPGTIRNCP